MSKISVLCLLDSFGNTISISLLEVPIARPRVVSEILTSSVVSFKSFCLSSSVHFFRSHLMRDKTRAVPAMSTGKQSEVVILGVGAVAMCRGIQYPGNSKAG